MSKHVKKTLKIGNEEIPLYRLTGGGWTFQYNNQAFDLKRDHQHRWCAYHATTDTFINSRKSLAHLVQGLTQKYPKTVESVVAPPDLPLIDKDQLVLDAVRSLDLESLFISDSELVKIIQEGVNQGGVYLTIQHVYKANLKDAEERVRLEINKACLPNYSGMEDQVYQVLVDQKSPGVYESAIVYIYQRILTNRYPSKKPLKILRPDAAWNF